MNKKESEVSGVRKIMADIEETIQRNGYRDIINLSAGNPLIIQEVSLMWQKFAKEIVMSDEYATIVGRYGSSAGYEPFIDAVVDYFNSSYGWDITSDNVLVSNGTQSIFYFAINTLAGFSHGKRRKVLYPICPDYTGYSKLSLLKGINEGIRPKINILGEHTFKYTLDIERLKIGDDIAAVIFSRPSNPTGNVISDRDVKYIISQAKKSNCFVFIDSAYGPPIPNIVFTAMNIQFDDNVIHTLSFSKAGLPGERVGVAIGAKTVIIKLKSFITNCLLHSSRFGQALAKRALESGELEDISRNVIKPFYYKKLCFVQEAIQNNFSSKIPYYVHQVEGTFFLWIWFADLPVTDWELYARLKKKGVFIVPGSSFFIGFEQSRWKHKNECIRISLTASDEEIYRGIQTISEVINHLY